MNEQRIAFRIDEKFKRRVQIKALKLNKNVSEVITELLKNWLKTK